MAELNLRFSRSSASSQSGGSELTFGVDVSSQPVFLKAEVKKSVPFARAMLALARVVRLDESFRQKDHTAYQEWVQARYLETLKEEEGQRLEKLKPLMAKKEELDKALKVTQELVGSLSSVDLYPERRKFWNWLRNNNREAWIVLDPIVSVQPDATFFEAFSVDESVYARVSLPHDAISASKEPKLGTTNIDFSILLEREMARIRSYRSLTLTVGSDSVGVSTGVSETVEKKIDLPESWVRGLVEVQSAFALAPVEMKLESSLVADILARLASERERTGPRSLLFHLVPNTPISITVEPWGETFTSAHLYQGPEAKEIRVWGRRRLRVMSDLLVHTQTVSVRLLDSGLPSFWSINLDGIEFTVGLSGWTSQDWAGRARFSAFMPSQQATAEETAKAADLLKENQRLHPDDLVHRMNLKPTDARALLQRLCIAGKAMYDADQKIYRWRELFPQFQLDAPTDAGREERFGVSLVGSVIVASDRLENGMRTLETTVSQEDRIAEVTIRTDADGRVVYAQCDCSHFRFHKLRQGPCRHIVASLLV